MTNNITAVLLAVVGCAAGTAIALAGIFVLPHDWFFPLFVGATVAGFALDRAADVAEGSADVVERKADIEIFEDGEPR